MAEIGCGTVAFGPSLRVRVSPGGYPPGVCALVALVLPVWLAYPPGVPSNTVPHNDFQDHIKINQRAWETGQFGFQDHIKISSRSAQSQSMCYRPPVQDQIQDHIKISLIVIAIEHGQFPVSWQQDNPRSGACGGLLFFRHEKSRNARHF
jgi:hypothetical protein